MRGGATECCRYPCSSLKVLSVDNPSYRVSDAAMQMEQWVDKDDASMRWKVTRMTGVDAGGRSR